MNRDESKFIDWTFSTEQVVELYLVINNESLILTSDKVLIFLCIIKINIQTGEEEAAVKLV